MELSYLAIGIVVSALALGLAARLPAARAFVLGGGLLAVPAGFADAIFVPEYWQPRHLVGAWFSVEGALFSFGNGGLIGAIAWAQCRHQLPAAAPGLGAALLRLTALMLAGFGLFLALWQGALGPLMVMHAVLCGLLGMALLLWWRGALRPAPALTAGAGFALVYAAEVMLWHALDPALERFWAEEAAYLARLPLPPFLPVEELLWAVTYGAVWSGMLALAFARPSAR